ncbi:Protein FAM32A protein [Dioscorea alata]|uniref:Protein FAM32A protein n=3 Tax=Dioscorea alata TaxID=55571 RepID=A0ACB7W919_DIOAL|nr:Protein FAM32A protein [Dioscorea alata]KAH7684046.1 Protein FAM32A protein [Dioscorea alata]KAH7684047.1 Protein FAM32A protein [Dioscorea alata]
MSAYDNVVGGKLKLKGKALDVKAGGIKKKKKQKHRRDGEDPHIERDEVPEDGSSRLSADNNEGINEDEKPGDEGHASACDGHLTAAEKRYIEQRERIDSRRLAKTADKSHRDRIQDFNQYLANLSEHYDIPKVGPG